MKPTEAYQWLLDYSKTTAYYQSAMGLLHWDQRTCLPKEGRAHRSEQLAAMTSLVHRRATDPGFGEILAEAEAGKNADDNLSDEAVNLREWRRNYDRTTRIPESLAVLIARASSAGELAWQTARQQNDWEDFLPYLERIVDLKRQEAQALSKGGKEIYDALIDDFEPGETAAEIEKLFTKLENATFKLLEKIEAAPRKPDPAVLRGACPPAAQEAFIIKVITHLGYNFDAGRMDFSAHPFTSAIGPGDVRITTRFDPDSFVKGLFSSIHETGHALYSHGLPPKHWGTPLGSSISMAIHESQSRMWENLVGRSRGFWKHFYPAARTHFPWLGKTGLDEFLFALNEVTPSLIRTEADEVTYNLHIIMRFKLERMLIDGQLEPQDLPDAWNGAMERYFHILPQNHSEGVMQDIHWSSGAFGYFPSYALGNMYAAQFYAKAQKELGDLPEMFATGEFSPLLGWLRGNVHSRGSRLLPRDLVRAATGADLDADYLIAFLEAKYEKAYGLRG
ncbi:MAG: carboxypeptidase M32 [Syntrophobacteraceae bacterium]|nr:carboxypeptidase M32 [Syntrophobacteraceae bacterium]